MEITMRKISFILPSALLMLCIVGCSKDRPVVTDSPDISFGMHISDATGTKALLESGDLLTDGTQVKVYGFRGEDIIGHTTTPGTTKLNEGQTLQYGTSTGWTFINNNNEKYQWSNVKDHKFFGWLTKDAKSNIEAGAFFGTGFAFSGNVLSIPAKTLGLNTSNFDFAYSEIVNREAASADYSTVELQLQHLFSSFSLSARNYAKVPVTVKSIEIHGLKDGKSASIDYSNSSADCTYDASSASYFNPAIFSGTLSLSKAGDGGDSKANVVVTPSDTPAYFLVWPQDNLTYSGYDNVNKPYLKIVYNQGEGDITAYAAIPNDDGKWAAGVRYEMELSFKDREIDLGFKAASWDKMEPVIDYDGAVTVTQKLQLATEFFNNCTLSPNFGTDKTAYFKPGLPIILEFAIGSPENATWIVGKKLDWDAFDVYNYPDGARTSPDEIVTAEGVVDGNTVRIAIDPPTKDLQKTEFSLELTFSVRLNNGDMVSIDPADIYADGCPRKFVYIKM